MKFQLEANNRDGIGEYLAQKAPFVDALMGPEPALQKFLKPLTSQESGTKIMDRVFIMGNGGSGKTWLAQQLAQRLQLPAFHLDDFHWMPSFIEERPHDERNRLVAQAADGNSWVMEGICGSILRQVLPRVTTLIWLDVPDDECISNLLRRGQTGGGTEEQFEELLEYTRGYRLRKNHLNSFDAHEWFFEEHPFQKFRLSSRTDIATFLATV